MSVFAILIKKPEVPVSYLWAVGRDNQGINMQDAAGPNRSTPVKVGTLGTWEDVKVGSVHCLMLQSDGTIWTAGDDASGQMGQYTRFVSRSNPTQIGVATWSNISCGSNSSFGIKTDGTMWSWGDNNNGFLGIGTEGTGQNQSSPAQIGALTTWRAVDSGIQQVMALKTDNTLWAWGQANFGALGDLSTVNKSTPVQVGVATDWDQVSCGSYHSLGIKTNGTLWSWGYNNLGQLGLGDIIDRSSPMAVGAETDWELVSAGSSVSMAIKTDGTLWTWGSNSYGEVGQGNAKGTAHRSSPVQIGALTDWITVDAWQHCTAVRNNGTLWTWGRNFYGQCGRGDTIERSSPTQVGVDTDWLSASAGESNVHSLRGVRG